MKNFMVANLKEDSNRYNFDNLGVLLRAQIENCLSVGWKPKDVIIVANFDYEYMGVRTIKTELNNFCLTGSKIFGLEWLFKNRCDNETLWAHDLDAWQNIWFDAPEFQDVGISTYSTQKLNGGSSFWKSTARDIVEKIVRILKQGETKEEPTINKVLYSKKYQKRVSVLNTTYNVGCSGFIERCYRANKPIKVSHFNPNNKIAWETHCLNRNGTGDVSVSFRLEKLLRRYYPDLATELSKEGKERVRLLQKKNLAKIKNLTRI